MRSLANRADLLKVFAGIAGEFDQVKQEIGRREAELKEQLEQLEVARKKSPWAHSPLAQGHPLQKIAEACQQQLDNQLDAWIHSVENYERNTSFRKGFDDSLLVFVYGKVKAGKSSLGNYLAYGKSSPDKSTIEGASPNPEFFWHQGTGTTESMSADLMRQKRCFGVDVAEATSSIQGFRLPGMTWVDSPGVHSVNSVNGELASDYVACADLIVFLSNSASPGRRSDMAEVVELLEKRKNIMVLITGSDEIDQEVDDAGVVVDRRVMKSRFDRDDQIEFVSNELAALDPSMHQLIDHINVHSMSVRYAEEGDHEEQAARWQESGLAGFATDLGDIARSRGLALKRQTPLKNLQSFCRKLSESTELLEDELKKINDGLHTARRDLKIRVDEVMSRMRNELPAEIEKLTDCHYMNNRAFSEACDELFDTRFQRYASELCVVIGQNFTDINIQTNAVGLVVEAIPEFSDRFEKIHYESRRNESFGKAGGAGLGGWGGAEGGAILGTMILPGVGTVVGGLIGGALGAWAGSKAGGSAGEYFNHTEEMSVKVGDNRDEVSVAARQRFLKLAESQLNALHHQLDRLCYVDISNWLNDFQSALRSLRQQTRTHVQEIEKELINGVA